jgi:hypothetical protein
MDNKAFLNDSYARRHPEYTVLYQTIAEHWTALSRS